MVEAPKLGGTYWIIVDIWEQFAAAPVKLIEEDDGVFVGRWYLGEGYTEDYDGLEPRNLYLTEAAAWEEIKPEAARGEEKAVY